MTMHVFDLQATSRFCRQHGLSIGGIAVMASLAERGTLKMSEIHKACGFSSASGSGLVTRLVEKGLVSRINGEDDRRTVYCSISEKGTDTLKKFKLLTIYKAP